MLQEIATRYNVSLKGVHCVGDSLRDLQSGFVLGCIPNLVLTGKGQGAMDKGGLPPGTQIHSDLAAMVDALLNQASDHAH